MLQVPQDIQNHFNIALKNHIKESNHYNYQRWARYYFDFYSKYKFPIYEETSINHFLTKLSKKHQTPSSIEQANQASKIILSYYENSTFKDKFQNSNDVMQALIVEIRSRNYSPRTLEAYCGWIRSFFKWYDGTIEDIDDGTARQFLNHLVMERKVMFPHESGQLV